MMSTMFNPPHPGRMLAETLEYLGISEQDFARTIGTDACSVTRLLKGETPVTPEMADRISAAIAGPGPTVWLAIQSDYDAWQADSRKKGVKFPSRGTV